MSLDNSLDKYLQMFEFCSRNDPIVATAMRLIDHTSLHEIDALKVCIVELVRVKNLVFKDLVSQVGNPRQTIIVMRSDDQLAFEHGGLDHG